MPQHPPSNDNSNKHASSHPQPTLAAAHQHQHQHHHNAAGKQTPVPQHVPQHHDANATPPLLSKGGHGTLIHDPISIIAVDRKSFLYKPKPLFETETTSYSSAFTSSTASYDTGSKLTPRTSHPVSGDDNDDICSSVASLSHRPCRQAQPAEQQPTASRVDEDLTNIRTSNTQQHLSDDRHPSQPATPKPSKAIRESPPTSHTPDAHARQNNNSLSNPDLLQRASSSSSSTHTIHQKSSQRDLDDDDDDDDDDNDEFADDSRTLSVTAQEQGMVQAQPNPLRASLLRNSERTREKREKIFASHRSVSEYNIHALFNSESYYPRDDDPDPLDETGSCMSSSIVGQLAPTTTATSSCTSQGYQSATPPRNQLAVNVIVSYAVARTVQRREGNRGWKTTYNNRASLALSFRGKVIQIVSMLPAATSRKAVIQVPTPYPVVSLCLSSDSEYAVVAMGTVLRIYDLKDTAFKHVFECATTIRFGAVVAMALSPDGSRALLTYEDGVVELWNLTTRARTAIVAPSLQDDPKVLKTLISKGGDYGFIFTATYILRCHLPVIATLSAKKGNKKGAGKSASSAAAKGIAKRLSDADAAWRSDASSLPFATRQTKPTTRVLYPPQIQRRLDKPRIMGASVGAIAIDVTPCGTIATIAMRNSHGTVAYVCGGLLTSSLFVLHAVETENALSSLCLNVDGSLMLASVKQAMMGGKGGDERPVGRVHLYTGTRERNLACLCGADEPTLQKVQKQEKKRKGPPNASSRHRSAKRMSSPFSSIAGFEAAQFVGNTPAVCVETADFFHVNLFKRLKVIGERAFLPLPLTTLDAHVVGSGDTESDVDSTLTFTPDPAGDNTFPSEFVSYEEGARHFVAPTVAGSPLDLIIVPTAQGVVVYSSFLYKRVVTVNDKLKLPAHAFVDLSDHEFRFSTTPTYMISFQQQLQQQAQQAHEGQTVGSKPSSAVPNPVPVPLPAMATASTASQEKQFLSASPSHETTLVFFWSIDSTYHLKYRNAFAVRGAVVDGRFVAKDRVLILTRVEWLFLNVTTNEAKVWPFEDWMPRDALGFDVSTQRLIIHRENRQPFVCVWTEASHPLLLSVPDVLYDTKLMAAKYALTDAGLWAAEDTSQKKTESSSEHSLGPALIHLQPKGTRLSISMQNTCPDLVDEEALQPFSAVEDTPIHQEILCDTAIWDENRAIAGKDYTRLVSTLTNVHEPAIFSTSPCGTCTCALAHHHGTQFMLHIFALEGKVDAATLPNLGKVSALHVRVVSSLSSAGSHQGNTQQNLACVVTIACTLGLYVLRTALPAGVEVKKEQVAIPTKVVLPVFDQYGCIASPPSSPDPLSQDGHSNRVVYDDSGDEVEVIIVDEGEDEGEDEVPAEGKKGKLPFHRARDGDDGSDATPSKIAKMSGIDTTASEIGNITTT